MRASPDVSTKSGAGLRKTCDLPLNFAPCARSLPSLNSWRRWVVAAPTATPACRRRPTGDRRRRVRSRLLLQTNSEDDQRRSLLRTPPLLRRLLVSPFEGESLEPLTVPFLIGAAAGFTGSLIGVGGGIIITPLLTAFCDASQHEAHGTSLVAVALSSAVGSLAYWRGQSVHLMAAVLLSVAALVTARLGARTTRLIDAQRLKRFFGVFVVLAGILLFVKSGVSAWKTAAAVGAPSASTPTAAAGAQGTLMTWPLRIDTSQFAILACLLLTGCVTGFFSGLLGVGGGTIAVPALRLLLGLGQQAAQGTALAAMSAPAIIGAWTHWQLGHVREEVLLGLLWGVTSGSWMGGHVALKLSQQALARLCAALFVLMGARTVWVSTLKEN